MKRIAALVPNILNWSPGQRVRIESWAKHLTDYGWEVELYPFENDSLHSVLYRKGMYASKASRLTTCFFKQLQTILSAPPCDVLFIYREASLIGPAVIERLAKRLKVPIVYDIDDPIFLTDLNSASGIFSHLKFAKKTHTIFRLSNRVIAINDIIGDYARKFNPNVSVLPNFIDTERFCPAEQQSDAPLIGWSGSQSTMMNLAAIAEPLRRLQEKYDVPMRVVGTGGATLDGVKLDVRQWTAETEVSDLQDCNIGVVPLLDIPANRWKFFLKVVQYLGIGLPVVAQKMASNSAVIQDGVNGFLVETPEEWYSRISLLIENPDLRRKMSRAARQTALERYSLHNQMPSVAAVFDEVLAESKNGSASARV